MNSNNKCKHGYYTDPNGYHIYPQKTTAELIEEANKLFNIKTTVEPKTEQETKPRPRPRSKNEVRAFHRLLNDAADY